MLLRDTQIVPSVMFHSIGLEDWSWEWSYISESVASFEGKLALLKKKHFNGIAWEQLYGYMSGTGSLPDNPIFLTFDDGYLDNWVFLFPLLKKYGFKATIFVNPDFVDPCDRLRPNLEDVWNGNLTQEDLETAGFLSWPEMRAMEDSGLVDIQSHALTHTWYFTSPTVVDYHRRHDVTPNPWLFWNRRPERKPYYLVEDQQDFVPEGSPIFEHQKSLVARRFFPDEEAVSRVCEFIRSQGVETFHATSDWQQTLNTEIQGWFGGALPGHYESDEDHSRRVHDELAVSKALIEKNLNKTVDFICWPGGGNEPLVHELAKQVGYKSWTLGSQEKSDFRNVPNSHPGHIKRIGSSNAVHLRSKRLGNGGPHYFLNKIGVHQNSLLHRLALLSTQTAHLIRSMLPG